MNKRRVLYYLSVLLPPLIATNPNSAGLNIKVGKAID
jgi:hypothetical protein